MYSNDFNEAPTRVDVYAALRARRSHDYWQRVEKHIDDWNAAELAAQATNYSDDFSHEGPTIREVR